MNWQRIKQEVESHFGADVTALAAAINEVALSRDPTYLDAIMAEQGSPVDRENAVIWWSKKRGQLWKSAP
jgi:hypothetical protein